MTPYIVSVLFLFLSLIVFVITRKKKKRAILFGRKLGKAMEIEKQRVEEGNYGPSPLSDLRYSVEADDYNLINPVENELDKMIKSRSKEYAEGDEEKRNGFRKSLNQSDIYSILNFAKRATLFGIRKNDPSYLYAGFNAMAMIESERCDFRDVDVALGVLNFGLYKMKLDSSLVFNNAIRLSEGETRDILQGFKEKALKWNYEQMMAWYTPYETKYGIGFVNRSFEKYTPERDLVNILLDIANLLSGDKYSKGEISIAEKIPLVWTNAEKESKIQENLLNVTGCASLRADLRKDFDSERAQMLLLYLAEFSDLENLLTLNEQLQNSEPETFSRLCFAEGNIFCLLIQRSIVAYVEDFETNSSLQRFEKPLRGIIKTHL